jgi:hypothetical protein
MGRHRRGERIRNGSVDRILRVLTVCSALLKSLRTSCKVAFSVTRRLDHEGNKPLRDSPSSQSTRNRAISNQRLKTTVRIPTIRPSVNFRCCRPSGSLWFGQRRFWGGIVLKYPVSKYPGRSFALLRFLRLKEDWYVRSGGRCHLLSMIRSK